MQTIQYVVPMPEDTKTEDANTAVSIVYPATAGRRHVIFLVDASYSKAPTGGNLHIHRGDALDTSICLDIDIVAGGHTEVGYHMPIASKPGESLTITLAAGGADVVGKLSVEHYLAAN